MQMHPESFCCGANAIRRDQLCLNPHWDVQVELNSRGAPTWVEIRAIAERHNFTRHYLFFCAEFSFVCDAKLLDAGYAAEGCLQDRDVFLALESRSGRCLYAKVKASYAKCTILALVSGLYVEVGGRNRSHQTCIVARIRFPDRTRIPCTRLQIGRASCQER